MNDLHSNEKYIVDFIQAIHKLTRIPISKLEKYGQVNNMMNILEHPLVLEPTKSQLDKIEQLNMFLRAYRVIKWEEENAKQRIRSPKQAGDYFTALLEGVQSREKFMVAFLDNGNRLIETRTITEGGIDHALVHPRDILKAALNCHCSSMIFAHNHPGGTLSPSQEDIKLTNRMVDIFDPLNIKILDHIIIAGNSYVSLAETGNLQQVAERTASYEAFPLLTMEKQSRPEEQLNSLIDEDRWDLER